MYGYLITDILLTKIVFCLATIKFYDIKHGKKRASLLKSHFITMEIENIKRRMWHKSKGMLFARFIKNVGPLAFYRIFRGINLLCQTFSYLCNNVGICPRIWQMCCTWIRMQNQGSDLHQRHIISCIIKWTAMSSR